MELYLQGTRVPSATMDIFYGTWVLETRVTCQTWVLKECKLLNISQTVIKHCIFCQIVVFGHFDPGHSMFLEWGGSDYWLMQLMWMIATNEN